MKTFRESNRPEGPGRKLLGKVIVPGLRVENSRRRIGVGRGLEEISRRGGRKIDRRVAGGVGSELASTAFYPGRRFVAGLIGRFLQERGTLFSGVSESRGEWAHDNAEAEVVGPIVRNVPDARGAAEERDVVEVGATTQYN